MERAPEPEQCQIPPDLLQPSAPAEDASPPPGVAPPPPPPHPLAMQSDPDVLPSRTTASDAVSTEMITEHQGSEDEEDAEAGMVEESSECTAEEPSTIQPMELDASDTADVCPKAPNHPDSVEMEPSSAPGAAVPSEKDTPDEDRCSSSESVPSLAAALVELHELLVSNSRAQSQDSSMSCSPPCSLLHDADKASPEPRTPTPENTQPAHCTAMTSDEEPSDAKANDAAAAAAAAALSHVEQSECLVFDNDPGEDPTGTEDRSSQRDADAPDDGGSISQPEPELPPCPAVIPEVREPPEGQHERGVADGQASAPNAHDSLHAEPTPLIPSSSSEAQQEGVSSASASVPPLPQAAWSSSPAPLPPSPHPFTDHFPAEHIERIQAAGFSATEAVEALERADGVVELALLALLARSITVPT